jgi:hypothetical protein
LCKFAQNGGFSSVNNSGNIVTQKPSEQTCEFLTIQQSLQDIQQIVTDLEELRSELLSMKESLKGDTWDSGAIEQNIMYTAYMQLSEDTKQSVEEQNPHREGDKIA